MEQIDAYIDLASKWFALPLVVTLMATGLFFTIRFRFVQVFRFREAFRETLAGRQSGASGPLSPLQAFMTSLAATIGTGNIAGVATAIALGGPGALFWIWCTALVGMATKYAEVLLAVHFREVDENGEHVGGPMYAIKNGLGPRWRWLGVAFALTAGVAGFGIGNMVQANAIASVAEN